MLEIFIMIFSEMIFNSNFVFCLLDNIASKCKIVKGYFTKPLLIIFSFQFKVTLRNFLIAVKFVGVLGGRRDKYFEVYNPVEF